MDADVTARVVRLSRGATGAPIHGYVPIACGSAQPHLGTAAASISSTLKLMRPDMGHFMVLLILLFSSAAPTSAAEDSSGDYAKLLNEQNLVFLQDLVKRIEQTG